jgi:acyl-CoA thioesterase-2
VANVLTDLLELLRLERIEQNLFRGQSQDLGFRQVFGGQVLGQALSAAEQTVDDDRPVHSLHAYFLRPGDAYKPIVYDVDPIRDGRSFTTRRVVAIQNGRPIFNLAASFQRVETGFEHQDEMPEAPGPDGLISELEIARKFSHVIPERVREKFTCDRPIEIREVSPRNPLDPKPRDPQRFVWFRAIDRMPDELRINQYMLAYASDFSFLTTSMDPHGVSVMTPDMQVASLDHAMWFHRPFRFDEWLLYVVDSPSASGARGLVRGRWFTRDGRLVASTAQEGLIRRREPRAPQPAPRSGEETSEADA